MLKRIYKIMKDYLGKKAGKTVVGYSGDYKSFEDAEKASKMHNIAGGYDADAIFNKVKESTLKVINGEAVFERDSFLFYNKQINYNLMMYLYKLCIKDDRLNVLDFGGALGSTYWQHRSELNEINAKWTITEQGHFVAYGHENLETENLKFASNNDLENQWQEFNVLLCSSSLQYIKDADSLINFFCEKGIKNIIIERTPVSNHKRFWIETVHEPIYEAVYPCCVFEEQDFINKFTSRGYKLVDSWKSLVDGDVETDKGIVEFKSFVFGVNE